MLLSAIKFGTSQFLTSNPPANTICLALDFDDRQLYMITSECKVLLSDLMTAHLLGEDGKIKANINLPDNILSIENVSTFPAAATNNTLYIDNSNEIKIYTNNSWKDVSLETVNDFTTVSNETVPTTQAVKTYVDSSIVFPPKQLVAATDKNIIFIPQKSIYTYTVSSATTFTFALDALESNTCYTFELWLKMQTVSPLTFPNNIVWLSGTAPIMNETKTYCIVVRKLPSNLVTTGKNILLNLAYKIDL